MMASFADHLLSKGHSRSSVRVECEQLGYFLVWCDQQNIEPEECGYGELLGYVQHMRKGGRLKAITIQKYVGTLRHFFAWQIDHGRRQDNPAQQIHIKDIQRKQLHVILSKQELEGIYHSYGTEAIKAAGSSHDRTQRSVLVTRRNKAIVGLLVFQGLSSHQLQALKVQDLELRVGKVHVKGGRKHNGRTLTLAAAQVMDLMEYVLSVRGELLALSGKQSDALLVSTGKSHKLNNALYKLLSQLKQLHPKVKTLGQLRASVITHWLKVHNLREVQHKAGHRYVSSTEAYLVNQTEDLQADIDQFHPLG